MQIQTLTLTNVRAFTHAEFTFQPGMNLLVGINGAGKSTMLDSLTSVMSFVLPRLTQSKGRAVSLGREAITIGAEALEIGVELMTTEFPLRCTLTQQAGNGRTTFELVPNNDTVLNLIKQHDSQPIVVYFSTRRAVPNEREPSKSASSGGQSSAFADALAHRELNIREFTRWLLVHQSLGADGLKSSQRIVDKLKLTVEEFLDGYHNLRVIEDPEPNLYVDNGQNTINVRFLSDGQRSVLAFVLDLTRRLILANPKLENPTEDGVGLVLIDEIDLHLHPSWQRTIVERLTNTFPNCQFICSTHSPQIIGEVAPEKIILIKDERIVYPDQSLGMDTNWILRHLMGVAERDTDTQQKLQEIQAFIETEAYDDAEAAINTLRDEIGEFPELVRLQTQIDMIDFWANELLEAEKA